ncbi:hypothetical protein Tco_0539773 [Tanacetum coccineum]
MESLNASKGGNPNAGTKKFVVARFLDYKMLINRAWSVRVQDLHQAGSSSRSNSKGKGKDKRKNDKKGKGKSEYLAPKAGIEWKQKLPGDLLSTGDQPGHRLQLQDRPKRVNPRQANMVRRNVEMICMCLTGVRRSLRFTEACIWANSATADIKQNPKLKNQLGKKNQGCTKLDRGGGIALAPFAELSVLNIELDTSSLLLFTSAKRELGAQSRLYDKVVQDKDKEMIITPKDERQDQTEKKKKNKKTQ